MYRITSFGLIQTNDEAIESDSVVNLYVKMYMDSVSGDTYSCLQKGLFQYRYLVD